MTLPVAVLVFDGLLASLIAIDFVWVRRHTTGVLAPLPAATAAAALAALAWIVDRPGAFAVTGLAAWGCAFFAYANALAFLKRGITFSIIHNHARPAAERRADTDFVAIDGRLQEMRGTGWVAVEGGRWRLTGRGRRVVQLRRRLLRLLRTEAVG